MSESYKNSPKRKVWAKQYYKKYYQKPENKAIIKERTLKNYWINRIILLEKSYENEKEFLKTQTSLQLKELYVKIVSE